MTVEQCIAFNEIYGHEIDHFLYWSGKGFSIKGMDVVRLRQGKCQSLTDREFDNFILLSNSAYDTVQDLYTRTDIPHDAVDSLSVEECYVNAKVRSILASIIKKHGSILSDKIDSLDMKYKVQSYANFFLEILELEELFNRGVSDVDQLKKLQAHQTYIITTGQSEE